MICTYCSDEHPQDYICPQTPIAIAEMMQASIAEAMHLNSPYLTPEKIRISIDQTYEERTGRVKP